MNHTVSLKLSGELKEKGFPQETEFYWDEILGDRIIYKTKWRLTSNCSAPLLSEVLEKIPEEIKYQHEGCFLVIEKIDNEWNFCYEWYDDEDDYPVLENEDPEPCDAAAKLWLQLKGEGII